MQEEDNLNPSGLQTLPLERKESILYPSYDLGPRSKGLLRELEITNPQVIRTTMLTEIHWSSISWQRPTKYHIYKIICGPGKLEAIVLTTRQTYFTGTINLWRRTKFCKISVKET